MKKEAIFNEERTYRYSIKRIWNASKKRVLFVCLNPSTADEFEDDQTLSRCIGFSQRWENGAYGSVEIVNLFAFQAKDPKVLKQSTDPIGELNDRYILEAVRNADLIVAAWGEHGSYKNRNREVLYLIKEELKPTNTLFRSP